MPTSLSKGTTIYMETNPNPHALKFVVDRMLIPEGMSFDFPTAESATNAPLARELFTYDFVLHVFYMDNFITLTKKKDIEWIEVQDILRVHIRNFVEGGQPIIDPSVFLKNQKEKHPEIVQKIKTILDEYIRPAVQQDGGAIIFDSYVNGVVKVSLQGACRGCPASAVTLKTGVENLFKKMMPHEVTAVEALE